MVGILVGCIVPASRAIDLSLLEFSSEDELVQALLSGDVTEEEMQKATDALFASGLSSSYAMWDGDPFDRDWYSSSATDPSKSHDRNTFDGQTILRYRYQQAVSQSRPSQYQIRGRSAVTPHWQVAAGIDRSYAGRERVRHRALTYSSRTGAIREVIIGNFSQKLGLGTIFGNRGKILGRSGELDGESMLVPDYGGGNGLHGLASVKNWNIAGVASFDRDTAISHTLMAISVSRTIARTALWLTAGNSRLGSRVSSESRVVTKMALGATYTGNHDRISSEVTIQQDNAPIIGAAILEGKSERGDMTLHYSGWVYHDDFVDDASGSRSGSLRHQWRDSISGAEWSTRRSGAEGLIVRSNWDIPSGWILSTTFLVSAWKPNYSETRFAANAERHVSSRFTITGEYLQRNNNRPLDEDELREQWLRAGFKYHSGKASARTAIGLINRDSSRYLSWLFAGHVDLSEYRRLEWWVDIRRIGLTPRAVDYGSAFAQLNERWSKTVETALKISTRHDSSSTEQWSSTISAEIELLL